MQASRRAGGRVSRDSDDDDLIILDPTSTTPTKEPRRPLSTRNDASTRRCTPSIRSTRASTLASSSSRPPRGSEGFSSSPALITDTFSANPSKRLRREKGAAPMRPSLPVGVPRPSTTSSSRLSDRSSRVPPPSRPLRTTQTRSPASSQDSLLLISEEPPRKREKKRSTTPSPSPPPAPTSRQSSLKPNLKKRPATPPNQRSGSPSISPATVRPPRRQTALRPLPVPPPSAFALPGLPFEQKASRSAQSTRRTASTLPAAIFETDFAALDPSSRYNLQHSVLFRLEHLREGPLTVEQGAKKGYGALKGAGGGKVKAKPPTEVPSWAKTADGREWQEDLIRRLSSRLLGSSATSFDDSLTPLVYAADVQALRKLLLGQAGGTECYLLGNEFPCKTVIVVGWVTHREYQEKEGGWIYVVDDGTVNLTVKCPAPAPDPFGTNSAPLSPARLIPHFRKDTSTSNSKMASMDHVKRKYGDLEDRADQKSAKTVIPLGALVKVTGMVEDSKFTWDDERRIVASRIDMLPDINSLPAHLLLVSRLHRDVYSQNLDLQARLAAIERAEAEERQREWEEGNTLSSSAGSDWGGGASTAGSPDKLYRPTRPSKLEPEDLTLSNFMVYIRHHLLRHFVRAVASADESPPSTPLASGRSFPTSSPPHPGTVEYSLPFTIADLAANRHLALFATRLVQERAKLAEQKQLEKARLRQTAGSLASAAGGTAAPKTTRSWVASGPMGGRKSGRETGGRGAASLLLPPPMASASSSRSRGGETQEERRARRQKEREAKLQDAGPLKDEALEKEVAKVWREAIRTMRANGMIVEFVEGPEDDEDDEKDDLELSFIDRKESRNALNDLPDLPSRQSSRTSPPKEQHRAAAVSACPWGDVKLEMSSPKLSPETPRAPKRVKREEPSSPAVACPWGDVKLEGIDVDDSVFKTPQPERIKQSMSPPVKVESPSSPAWNLPPSFQRSSPTSRAHRSPSAASDASFVTTGSLSDGARPQSFQLVTVASLCPLVLDLLSTAYASNVSSPSVTEADLRQRMYQDDRWARVALYSEAVTAALSRLATEGQVQRHGQGWRPVRRW
uniref:BY PROTMAP: gi/647401717/emb/CDR48072.1/ RHTO0S16e00650g2_1 [Rhodosporidium toruloides] n=1 Tax=Rhodotorula toruloides TaxID=5286 RepID=A0A0K3CP21_RHOTO